MYAFYLSIQCQRFGNFYLNVWQVILLYSCITSILILSMIVQWINRAKYLHLTFGTKKNDCLAEPYEPNPCVRNTHISELVTVSKFNTYLNFIADIYCKESFFERYIIQIGKYFYNFSILTRTFTALSIKFCTSTKSLPHLLYNFSLQ